MLSRQPVIVAGDLSARISLLCQLQPVMMMIFIIMIIVIVMMILLMIPMTMVIMAGHLSARISLPCQLQPVMMMISMKIILLIKIMGLPRVTTQFMYKPYEILKIMSGFNVEDTI